MYIHGGGGGGVGLGQLGLGQRVVLAVDVGVEALVRLAGCISGGSIFSLMVWWLLC